MSIDGAGTRCLPDGQFANAALVMGA